MIAIENHGPLILSTNYWQSEQAIAGKLFVSVNAGAIRVLLPSSMRGLLTELRTAKYAVLSRGPWPEVGAVDGIEILWEDGTDSPYCWHLTPASFDALPAEPPEGRGWVIALWLEKKGKPNKAMERPCHWRRVPQIPYLKPLGE